MNKVSASELSRKFIKSALLLVGPGCSALRRQKHSLVSVRADARGLVVLGAVRVGGVVERAVPAPGRATTALVLEVPVEASEGAVLLALVLQEQRALVHAELLQIPAGEEREQSGGAKPNKNFFVVAVAASLESEVGTPKWVCLTEWVTGGSSWRKSNSSSSSSSMHFYCTV